VLLAKQWGELLLQFLQGRQGLHRHHHHHLVELEQLVVVELEQLVVVELELEQLVVELELEQLVVELELEQPLVQLELELEQPLVQLELELELQLVVSLPLRLVVVLVVVQRFELVEPLSQLALLLFLLDLVDYMFSDNLSVTIRHTAPCNIVRCIVSSCLEQVEEVEFVEFVVHQLPCKQCSDNKIEHSTFCTNH